MPTPMHDGDSARQIWSLWALPKVQRYWHLVHLMFHVRPPENVTFHITFWLAMISYKPISLTACLTVNPNLITKWQVLEITSFTVHCNVTQSTQIKYDSWRVMSLDATITWNNMPLSPFPFISTFAKYLCLAGRHTSPENQAHSQVCGAPI